MPAVHQELLTPETPLEAAITSDPGWVEGMRRIRPQPGHADGTVGGHTVDVLANVDRFARTKEERRDLRLIALLHDCCKMNAEGRPHPSHGRAARELAERHIDDERLLVVIELHDDAFQIHRNVARFMSGYEPGHEQQLDELLSVLREHDAVDLYLQFLRCDSMTVGRPGAPYAWFAEQLGLSEMPGP